MFALCEAASTTTTTASAPASCGSNSWQGIVDASASVGGALTAKAVFDVTAVPGFNPPVVLGPGGQVFATAAASVMNSIIAHPFTAEQPSPTSYLLFVRLTGTTSADSAVIGPGAPNVIATSFASLALFRPDLPFMSPSYANFTGAGGIQTSGGTQIEGGFTELDATRSRLDAYIGLPIFASPTTMFTLALRTTSSLINPGDDELALFATGVATDFAPGAMLSYILAFDESGNDISDQFTFELGSGGTIQAGPPPDPSTVPEPSTVVLLLGGLVPLLGVGLVRRRRRR